MMYNLMKEVFFLYLILIYIYFFRVSIIIDKGGEEIHIKGKEGDSILDAIVDNNVEIPGYGMYY